jgi:hypothetical protein
MQRHSHEMVMVPRLWAAASTALIPPLSWSVFPFQEGSRAQIPAQQGVYAFLITPNIAGDLNVSYLMYVGETDRPLRDRFGDYLREARSDRIRPKLLRILPLYPDHLFFACAPLPTGTVPKDVESVLLEAFMPPGNDQIPATVRRARRATAIPWRQRLLSHGAPRAWRINHRFLYTSRL